MGCGITVTYEENGKITEIAGNTCPRGAEYARNEITNPTRTVTSTMVTADGGIVPVKTDRPIPKNKIFDCMKILNSRTADTDVKIGDVAIPDVFGANIVVSGPKEK